MTSNEQSISCEGNITLLRHGCVWHLKSCCNLHHMSLLQNIKPWSLSWTPKQRWSRSRHLGISCQTTTSLVRSASMTVSGTLPLGKCWTRKALVPWIVPKSTWKWINGCLHGFRYKLLTFGFCLLFQHFSGVPVDGKRKCYGTSDSFGQAIKNLLAAVD